MRLSRTSSVFCLVVVFGLLNPSRPAGQQLTPDPATRLTKVEFIVTDEKNQSVDGIRAEDLELTYAGVPQKITYFEKVERPVVSAIVVDTSASFRPLLAHALTAVKFLIESKRPNDETMLVRFAASDYIEHVVPFTSDKSVLLGVTLDNFSVVGGQSAVLDALYVSAESTAKHKPSDASFRRAVVLISDGEDRASFYSRSKVTNLLKEQNVQAFLIGMTSELTEQGGFIRRSPRQTAETLLTTVAKDTGGRVFFPRNPKELFEAVDQISKDLRSQYVVGFERSMAPGEKGYQKFKLKMAPTSTRPKLKIITRPGLWLSPPETKEKK